MVKCGKFYVFNDIEPDEKVPNDYARFYLSTPEYDAEYKRIAISNWFYSWSHNVTDEDKEKVYWMFNKEDI